jgi:hypothetical protein
MFKTPKLVTSAKNSSALVKKNVSTDEESVKVSTKNVGVFASNLKILAFTVSVLNNDL